MKTGSSPSKATQLRTLLSECLPFYYTETCFPITSIHKHQCHLLEPSEPFQSSHCEPVASGLQTCLVWFTQFTVCLLFKIWISSQFKRFRLKTRYPASHKKTNKQTNRDMWQQWTHNANGSNCRSWAAPASLARALQFITANTILYWPTPGPHHSCV